MFTKKIFLPLFVLVSAIVIMLAVLVINQPVNATQSKYTGHEDHYITLQEGMELTKNYRMSEPPNATLAYYFGKEALQKTLDQPGCVGLRMYNGKHTDGTPTLVIIGVDGSGNDLTKGIVLQRVILCPPDCCPSCWGLTNGQSFATIK